MNFFKAMKRIWDKNMTEKEPIDVHKDPFPDPKEVFVVSEYEDMESEDDVNYYDGAPRAGKYAFMNSYDLGDSGLEDDDADGPGWERRYEVFKKSVQVQGKKLGERDLFFEEYVNAKLEGVEAQEAKQMKEQRKKRAFFRKWKRQFTVPIKTTRTVDDEPKVDKNIHVLKDNASVGSWETYDDDPLFLRGYPEYDDANANVKVVDGQMIKLNRWMMKPFPESEGGMGDTISNGLVLKD